MVVCGPQTGQRAEGRKEGALRAVRLQGLRSLQGQVMLECILGARVLARGNCRRMHI